MTVLIITNIILVVTIGMAGVDLLLLEGEIKRLTERLDSCEDKINDMAQDNAKV